LPEDKPKEINKLRREGFRVGMIGSIPEDNESFNESELGITLNRGAGRELPPIDVILLQNNLRHVVSFMDISSRAMRIARENNILAYVYHLTVPLIAAGCLVPFGYTPLTPIIGALLSGTAFLFVMLNTHRIMRNP
jgi:Cu+-exporting ATPase